MMLKECWEIDVIKNCDSGIVNSGIVKQLIRDSLIRKSLTWESLIRDPGFVKLD